MSAETVEQKEDFSILAALLRVASRCTYFAWRVFVKIIHAVVKSSAWVTVRFLCVAIPISTLVAIISAMSHGWMLVEDTAIREARASYTQGVDYIAREHGYVVPRIIEPSEPETIEKMLRREMRVNGIPNGMFGVLRALIKWESAGDNSSAVSKAGAIGLMQVMPEHVKFCGLRTPVELFDPTTNVACGTRLFKEALDKNPNDLVRALKHYNTSPKNIDKSAENRAYANNVFRTMMKLGIEGY